MLLLCASSVYNCRSAANMVSLCYEQRNMVIGRAVMLCYFYFILYFTLLLVNNILTVGTKRQQQFLNPVACDGDVMT